MAKKEKQEQHLGASAPASRTKISRLAGVGGAGQTASGFKVAGGAGQGGQQGVNLCSQQGGCMEEREEAESTSGPMPGF